MTRPTTEDLPPGTVVGPYQVVRALPQGGGMARIFLVEVREKYRRPDVPRYQVLKVARAEFQDALVAETEFLARFNHPNVVRIYPLPVPQDRRPRYAAREQFSSGWYWYYAMEYISGGSLHRRLTRSTTLSRLGTVSPEEGRRLSVREAVRIACQILSGLEHIHGCSVVNLDIKPSNILFRRSRRTFLNGKPQAVICDFGIARDLRYPRSGLLGVATPEYVSPEQVEESVSGKPMVDARSDLFSLGIVIYEMLTGRLPFIGVEEVVSPNPPIPPREFRRSIPPALEKVILRALAKDPAERFSSAAEMRAALEQVPIPPDWSAAGRRLLLIAGLAAAAGLALLRPWEAFRPAVAPRVHATRTPTATISLPTPSAKPTTTVRPTPTHAPRPTSTLRPTNTPRPTATRTPSPTPTPLPTNPPPTPSPWPTDTPEPRPAATRTPSPPPTSSSYPALHDAPKPRPTEPPAPVPPTGGLR